MSFDLFNGRCPYCDAMFRVRQDYDLHMVKCEAQEAELHRQQQLSHYPENVRRLPGAPVPGLESVKATVEILEEMLAAAKRGDVRSIAMTYSDGGRQMHVRWHNNGEFMKLLGAVSWLAHEMNCDPNAD